MALQNRVSLDLELRRAPELLMREVALLKEVRPCK